MNIRKATRPEDDLAASPAAGFGGNFLARDREYGNPFPLSGRMSARRILWNRRAMICLTVLGCVALFGLYGFSRPKLYTRSCEIMIDAGKNKTLNDSVAMDSYLNTQAELISSSTAIHTLALSILRDRQEKGSITLTTIGGGEDDLATIRDGLNATASRTADIIYLQFVSRRSDEAAHVLSALAEAYTRFTSADHKKPLPDAYKSVVADKDKWDKEIHEGHSKLATLEGEITLLQMQEGVGNIDAQTLQSMSEESRSARARSVDAKTAFERVAKSMIPDPDKLDGLLKTGRYNGTLIVPGHDEAQIKTELFAVRQKLNELKERYLPNHPAVVALQAKADEINATYVLYLYREWASADRHAKDLDVAFEDQKKRVTDAAREIRGNLAMRQEQLKEIRDTLDEKKKLTNLLAGRLEEATSLDSQSAVIIHVMHEPDPQGEPDKVRPDIKMLLLEGLLAGLALGITLAFVDPRLRSVDEAAAVTNLPVLGVIPRLPRSQNLQAHARAVHLDPMSDAAEAFRGIRSAVHFGRRSKTILVTSAENSEGKSTIAANLAIAMAEAGQRVLLVDANLRKPAQQSIFSTPLGDAGVSGVVSGRIGIDQAIQKTHIRFLELMPSGRAPFNPSEMINNQMFADLLTQLGSLYDFVVVDSPSVLSVTDSRILGAMCDVTLMVVRAGRSNRRAAIDGRDGLLGFGANLLGVIVNGADPNLASFGHFGAPALGPAGALARERGTASRAASDSSDPPQEKKL
jgi:capsular exopolysaccharide synthesis family protein